MNKLIVKHTEHIVKPSDLLRGKIGRLFVCFQCGVSLKAEVSKVTWKSWGSLCLDARAVLRLRIWVLRSFWVSQG